MYNQAVNAYKDAKRAAVLTADPMKLIIMMYEEAIKNLNLAKKSIESGNIEKRNEYIYKAQDFINELMNALNFEKGGEIAKNLYSLYEYFIWRLNMSIAKNDPEMVQEVIDRMNTLLDAWNQIYNQYKETK